MKKTSTFFLFLLFVINCKSQDYIPFPDSNAIWKIVWTQNSPPFYSNHYDYTLKGDTIINNVKYVKILHSELGIYCSLDTLFRDYTGAFRNDNENKKVYYIPKFENEESLLYDFSLDIGDTVPQTIQNWLYPYLSVKEIDTINIGNQLRRRFTYWEGPDPLGFYFYVYEGIGADFGLLEYFLNVENDYYLKCFHENDSLIYIHPGDSTCVLEADTCILTTINTLNEINDYYFNVYCANNQVVIQHNYCLRDISIRVFDIQGVLIHSTKVHSDIININLQSFHNGLYFFLLQNNNQILNIKKVIINL